jgi:hypothetical protein
MYIESCTLVYRTTRSRYRNVVLRGHGFEQGEPLGGGEGNGEGERGMGRVRRVQFTANRGQERTGIRTTAQRRDFQVSKGGIFQTKRGVARKGVVGIRLNVYIELINDCI